MYNKIFAPKILTNRLLIRLVEFNDFYDYFLMCSDIDVCRYLTFNPYDNDRQAQIAINNMLNAYMNGTDTNFTIILKETNQIIGSISLTFHKENNSAEIGYILNKNFWHNGYMDEALKAIIKTSFEYYHLDFIIANYIDENVSSAKLLDKNGFVIYDHLNKAFMKNHIAYNITKTILTKR